MPRSSPSEVRDRFYCDCSLSNVSDALTDLVLALMSEDAPDSAVNPVDYVLTRVAGLVGTESVAHRHLAELFNNLRDKYQRRS